MTGIFRFVVMPIELLALLVFLNDIDVYVDKRTLAFSSFKWVTEKRPLETQYTSVEKF